MFARNRLTLAVTIAMGVAAAGLLAPDRALAQSETVIEEVVVTGSRISRNPETYLGGMAIAAGEDIEKIGSYNTLDLLQKLPAIGSQGTGRNQSNGGRGANFVEIHNLEAERTLVLMDGRRVVPTIRDSLGLAVDMQSFPANMIDRIEVLADGASAVYGSDAVAGVVNVIMKNDFEGFEISGGYGEPSEDGGEARNLGMLFGVQGGRGRIVAGGTYVETENVDYLERDWSKIPILGEASDGEGGKLILLGSGVPPQGYVPSAGIIFEPDRDAGTSYSAYDTFGFSGLNGCPADGSIDAILCTNHRFNYNDPGGDGVSLINGSRVFNFGTLAEIDFDNGFSAYSTVLAQHREGRLNFTPQPVSGAAGRFTDLLQVPFDNPHVPADALPVIREANPDADTFQLFYRGLDLGNRRYDYDNDTMQATLGFKGDFEFFGSGWSADLWGTWGQSRLTEVTSDQVNVNNEQIALDPARCARDSACPKDVNGNPTFDPFGRGPKSDEEKAYILFDDHEKTEYEMYHLAATISSGDLFQLPAGSLGFAAGIEYREESGSVTPSGTVTDGNSGGNFNEPTKGNYDLYEIYAEFDIPILSGLPFAEELGLELAGRFSDYGDFDETTWKVGGRWAPLEMLTFRAQASTGFRAPNVLELFGGNADNFIGVTDPCNAVVQASNPTIAANCASQGVPPTFTQPAAQLKVTQGGNPELEPETSDNFTIGLVLTPEIWGNPRIAIDYYDVQIDGAISTPNAADVIDTCYQSPGLSAPECDRIARGRGFDVVRFDLLLENLNEIKTSGYDMNATFAWDTPIGVLSADWLVTYLDEWVQTTDTGIEDDRTGKVACDVCDFVGYPEWKSALTGTLSQNNWSVSLAWRYIDEMEIDDQIGFDELNPKADEVHYFDLYGAYNWDNIQISVGMENFTDEEPPFVPSISANTAPIYDWLGRFYYARVKFSF
jgi:iron complex outermembrane receptor protein